MKLIGELKKASKKINDKFFRARSRYIKYYENLPIDPHCVLLESQHGNNLNGNIYYIAEYLATHEKYQDYKLYFVARGRKLRQTQNFFQERNITNVEILMLASDKYFRVLASAKYLFNDTSFTPSFIKKDGQVYLNTWHGTPLKTLGRKSNSDFYSCGNVQKNLITSDYILCPNHLVYDSLVKDYMIQNLSEFSCILTGYPRNQVFFDNKRAQDIREKLELTDKRVYVYMPTYRGTAENANNEKSDVYLHYYLFEIDKCLSEDEILYVNFHPLVSKKIKLNQFTNIRPFPQNYETYEILSAADCLITDYSSVFFDFANTRRKIVLFPYDEKDYIKDRGMYMELSELPFPKVYDIPSLLKEIRSPINYHDADFLQKYCKYESIHSTKELCDFIFFGEKANLIINKNSPKNKDNVIIYAGNIAGNGITTSLRNLLNLIDLNERNYYLAFKSSAVKKNIENLKSFPEQVNYISLQGDMNITIMERIVRKLFKMGWIHAHLYMRLLGKRISEEWKRYFGTASFSTAIQFNGYESEMILLWSKFTGNNVIFVHNDMIQEISMKKNQRRDVLQYAYSHYNSVAAVTEDIIDHTHQISKRLDNIKVCHNVIDYHSVLEKSSYDLQFTNQTTISKSEFEVREILNNQYPKFITIGRYSPEKGHLRLLDAFKQISTINSDCYLFIIGGYSVGNYYNLILKKVFELGLENRVVLVLNLPNPFPILKACDYFVLSSFYEGFGLVLAEANILNKPVISTNIIGPSGFVKKYGGTLVDNSEEGIYQGMLAMLNGDIKPINVDYEKYNAQALNEFELLF